MFGFPKDRVLKIATDVIGDFLFKHELLVYLVVFDKDSYAISEKLFSDIESFIDDTYRDNRHYNDFADIKPTRKSLRSYDRDEEYTPEPLYSCAPSACPATVTSLDDMLQKLDCGFTETLFRNIDEKGISDVEC